MFYFTEITVIKRRILSLLCEYLFNNEYDKIREIPYIISSYKDKPYRCCVYHDRAITSDRIKILLGLDENKFRNVSWNDCLQSSIASKNKMPFIYVMTEACHECPQKRYYITEACQHCVAHPCKMNCPKNAIEILSNRAVINEDLCVECSLCSKLCPYHAIIEVSRPCENSCPVNAIKTNECGIAEIDESKCILCGRCMLSCPFGAIVEKSYVKDFILDIKNGIKINAVIAPSIVGQFSPKANLEQIITALKKCGLHEVVEAAEGADAAGDLESSEILQMDKHNKKFLTSSCCPSFVNCLKMHYPALVQNISSTLSPMLITAAKLKTKFPEYKTVFIGPCISKKKEAEEHNEPLIDYVLTFEEIACIFAAKKIDVSSLDKTEILNPATKYGRGFGVSGGVIQAIKYFLLKKNSVFNFNAKLINGINKETLKILKGAAFGKTDFNFIEGMCCEDGCIGGPGIVTKPQLSKKILNELLSNSDDEIKI
ncbi:monomeric [FeFe] hydrogenase [Candidatus Dependentiae bacterium]|nr:monomeric [FeFe] hydrogenase [Candidatus Dependentiae bacterium]